MTFFSTPLSKAPSAFGLIELKKGLFPHIFNSRDNEGYVQPTPDVFVYDPDGITAGKREEFLTRFDTQKGRQLHLDSEMLECHRSDVDIQV